VIFAIIGLTAGILAGLFGIGGGILIVPALVVLTKMPPQKAIGTSLASLLLPVGALGAWRYYRADAVDPGAAAWVALGLVLGAWAGAQLGVLASPKVLQRGFSVFMAVVAGYMWLRA